MAAIKATMNGVVIDYYGRVISGPVKIVGELMYSDRGPDNKPPAGGGGGGDPPGIWGGPIDPYPGHPLPEPPGKPPGIWGGSNEPFPTPPIYLPPNVPPPLQPPTQPNPGDPTTAVPGNWPATGIVPPPYIVVQYPGIGPVVVAPPAPAG